MNKTDILCLIAGKCFNNSTLSKDECETIQKTSTKELLDQGFNLNQIENIRACCKKSKNLHYTTQKECN